MPGLRLALPRRVAAGRGLGSATASLLRLELLQWLDQLETQLWCRYYREPPGLHSYTSVSLSEDFQAAAVGSVNSGAVAGSKETIERVHEGSLTAIE